PTKWKNPRAATIAISSTWSTDRITIIRGSRARPRRRPRAFVAQRSVDAEGQQHISSRRAPAHCVPRPDVDHPIRDHGARHGNRAPVGEHLVDGLELLRRIEFPELLAIRRRHGVQLAVRGTLKDDAGDNGGCGTKAVSAP